MTKKSHLDRQLRNSRILRSLKRRPAKVKKAHHNDSSENSTATEMPRPPRFNVDPKSIESLSWSGGHGLTNNFWATENLSNPRMAFPKPTLPPIKRVINKLISASTIHLSPIVPQIKRFLYVTKISCYPLYENK